jgi:CheY-like chemotaxis protein
MHAAIQMHAQLQEEPAIAFGDASDISDLVRSLCAHASRLARRSGGVIQAELSDCFVDEQDRGKYPEVTPGPYVRLTIRGTGRGIDKDLIDRVFAPFASPSSPGDGASCGLFVVWEVLRSHRGTIRVHVTCNEGTTIEILLPGPAIAAAERIKAEKAMMWQRGIRVLFVDDDEALTRLGRKTLERRGGSVVTETSCLHALETFRANPHEFDVVITDLLMPGMNGLTLCRELVKIRPDTPTVVCTGSNDRISENEEAVKQVLVKPASAEQLTEAIRQAIRSSGKEKADQWPWRNPPCPDFELSDSPGRFECDK